MADNSESRYILPWTRQAVLDAYRRAGLTVDDIDVYVVKIIILFIIGFIFVTSIYILMHLAVMEDINIPFDLKLNLYLVNTIIYLGLYYPVFKTIQSISNFKTKNKYD